MVIPVGGALVWLSGFVAQSLRCRALHSNCASVGSSDPVVWAFVGVLIGGAHILTSIDGHRSSISSLMVAIGYIMVFLFTSTLIKLQGGVVVTILSWSDLHFIVSNCLHLVAFRFYQAKTAERKYFGRNDSDFIKTSSLISRALLVFYGVNALYVIYDWVFLWGFFSENSGLVPWLMLVKLAQARYLQVWAKRTHSVRTEHGYKGMAANIFFLAISENVVSLLHSGPSTKGSCGILGQGLRLAHIVPLTHYAYFVLSIALFWLATILFESTLVGFSRYDEGIVVAEELLTPCLKPFAYIADTPGKGIRRKFLKFMRKVLPVSDDFFEELERYVSDMHHVSLILDDIQDGSVLRRGKPSTHIVFGVPQALNAACLQLSVANSRLFKFLDASGHQGLVHVINDELSRAFFGQGMELWRRDGDSVHGSDELPSIEEYKVMVSCKTTMIFRLSALMLMSQSVNESLLVKVSKPSVAKMLGAALSSIAALESRKYCLYKEILSLIEEIGLLFQMRDDYRNLTKYVDTKGFCDDFSEGKWSYPVLVFLRIASSSECAVPPSQVQKFLSLLRSRPSDFPTKQEMLNILMAAGAIDQSKEEIDSLECNIRVRLIALDMGLEGLLPLLKGMKGSVEL